MINDEFFALLVANANKAVTEARQFWQHHHEELVIEDGHGYSIVVCNDQYSCPYHSGKISE